MSFQNLFNPDFIDFIEALNANDVDYVLVGGYAVNLHGHFRGTGDMDIWVKPTKTNYRKLSNAFFDFGLSLFDMVESKFLDTESYDVFSFGRKPISIEIMTKVKGLDYTNTAKNRISFEIKKGVFVQTISLDDLIAAKKASARYKDLDDIEHLT